jgi:hypothetical protein
MVIVFIPLSFKAAQFFAFGVPAAAFSLEAAAAWLRSTPARRSAAI